VFLAECKEANMSRSPTQDDVEVGRLLRVARKRAKLSQSELGDMVGITYQQIQKYENGTDRIAVSRLLQMARGLGADPVSLLPLEESEGHERLLDDEGVEVLSVFKRIENAAVRRAAIEALKSFQVASESLGGSGERS